MANILRKTFYVGATALTLAAGVVTVPSLAVARGFGGVGHVGGGHVGGGVGAAHVGGGRFNGGSRFNAGGRFARGRGLGVGLGLGAFAAGTAIGTCGYGYGYYNGNLWRVRLRILSHPHGMTKGSLAEPFRLLARHARAI